MPHVLQAWQPTVEFLWNNLSQFHDVIFTTQDGIEVPHYTILYPYGSLDSFSSPSPTSPSVRFIAEDTFDTWKSFCHEDRQPGALVTHHGHGDYRLKINNEAISVHRVLLQRIPYFASLFNPGFASSTSDSTQLPADIFTPTAVRKFVKFLYIPALSSPTGPMRMYPKEQPEAFQSPLEVVELLDIFRAADFLQFDQLEEEAVGALRGKLSDPDGKAATAAAMKILAGMIEREIDDASDRARLIVDSAIEVLAAHPGAWKRPVIELPDDVHERVISAAKNRVQDSLEALKLWSAVRRLQDEVDKSRSKTKDLWGERVFEPLLNHAAQVAAARIEDGVLAMRLRKAVTMKRDIGELLVAAVKVGMGPKNALNMWRAADEVGGEMKAETVKWMKQRWTQIVVEDGFRKGGWSAEERRKVANAIARKPEELLL